MRRLAISALLLTLLSACATQVAQGPKRDPVDAVVQSETARAAAVDAAETGASPKEAIAEGQKARDDVTGKPQSSAPTPGSPR